MRCVSAWRVSSAIDALRLYASGRRLSPPALLSLACDCCTLHDLRYASRSRPLTSSSLTPMTPREVLALCREKDVKAVDLRFMDFLGTWQHFTIPVGKLDEDVFEDGLGFDGSSIRGWQAINESDMLVVPQPETAFLDPFTAAADAGADLQHSGSDHAARPTAAIRGTSPRKAANYLKHTGIADTAYFGPEAEFFVFDDVRFDQTAHEALLPPRQQRRAVEPRPRWSAPNLGYKLRHKEGYFPVPAGRSADGPAQRDDAGDARLRPGRRGPSSRSRHRRAVRDRSAVSAAGEDGRLDA